jgi:hypothetical protein
VTGVTADSSDGCIVNNRFLCGVAQEAVPEAGTLALLAAGILGCALQSRSASRRRAASQRFLSACRSSRV